MALVFVCKNTILKVNNCAGRFFRPISSIGSNRKARPEMRKMRHVVARFVLESNE